MYKYIFGREQDASSPTEFSSLFEHFFSCTSSDTACDNIEAILHDWHIYSFDLIQHCLPCLAHAINLAVLAMMLEITRVEHIATTNAIWEFDPTLPANWLIGNSINVITAICTLAIKIQASGQHIAYFECIQKECGITTPLVIPLQNNTRWRTVKGMLGQSYQLH